MNYNIMNNKIKEKDLIKNLKKINELIINNPLEINSSLYINAYDLINIYCATTINDYNKQGEEIYILLKEDLTKNFMKLEYENITYLKKQINKINLLAIILKKIYYYLELYYIPINIELEIKEIMYIDILVYERFYSIYLNKQCNKLFIENKLIQFNKFLLIKINKEKEFIKLCNDFIILKKEECLKNKKIKEIIKKSNEDLNLFKQLFDYNIMIIINKKYIKYLNEKHEEIIEYLFKYLKDNKLLEASNCYKIIKYIEYKTELEKWNIYLKMKINKKSNFLDFLYFSWIIKYIFEENKNYYKILEDLFKICEFNLKDTKKIINKIYLNNKEEINNKLPFILIKPEIKKEKYINKINKYKSILIFLKNIFKEDNNKIKNIFNIKIELNKENEIFYKEIFNISELQFKYILKRLTKYTEITLKDKESFINNLKLNLLNNKINYSSTIYFLNKLNEFNEFNIIRFIGDINLIYKIRLLNINIELILLNSIFWDFIKEEEFKYHKIFLKLIKEIKINFIKYKIPINLKIIQLNTFILMSINGKRIKTNIIIASIILFINENNFKINELSKFISIKEDYLLKIINILLINKILKIGESGIIYIDDLFKDGIIINFNENINNFIKEKYEPINFSYKIIKLLKKYKKINKIKLFYEIKEIINNSSFKKSHFLNECEKLKDSGYLKEENNYYIYLP